jgi:Nif-specific regulatory protein
MKREIAIGHEYLGELAFEQGDYERAELCYEEAREIAEAIAPEGDLINEIYRRIGDLKIKTGDLEGAWLATERALEVSLNLGDRYEESLTYRVRGLVQKERGKREDALRHLELCLKTLSSVGEKYEAARTHLEIGILLGGSRGSDEELQQAGYYLQNAMDIFDDLDVIYYKAKTAIEMAKVHVTQGEDDMVLSDLKHAGDLVEGTDDEGEFTILVREICRSLEEAIVERVISSNSSDSPFTRSNVTTLGFSYNVEGLQGILYHIMDQVKANRGFIARRDGTSGDYSTSVVKGMDLSNCEKIINHFKTFDKRIFTDKRPFVSVDVTGDHRFDQLWTKVLFNVKSLAIVPFGVAEESVEGFCYVDRESSLSELPFLFHELEIMSNLSRSLALFVAALERDELIKDNCYLRNLIGRKPGFENIITQDPKMLEALNRVNRVKDSKIFVILMGETGTGKELIARAIHFTGARKNRKYLAVNCAAFPDNLLESELFGHKKGSFTGAMVDKKGLFEETNQGTFFLDEIADMGLPTQVKLLRVLDNGEIKRVGDTTVRRIDVRIISATNKDLSEEVKTGRFRNDLFYRLDGVMIEIPPLRDRRADIPLLISHFIEKYSAEEKKKIKGITPEALNLLVTYDWPGNVRELLNEIRRAIALLEDGDEIGPRILSSRIKRQVFCAGKGSEDARAGSTLPELMASFEKQRIFMALKDSRWVKTKAAKHLGIHEATLRGKMKRYGLEIPPQG